jgi:hypothetical protein
MMKKMDHPVAATTQTANIARPVPSLASRQISSHGKLMCAVPLEGLTVRSDHTITPLCDLPSHKAPVHTAYRPTPPVHCVGAWTAQSVQVLTPEFQSRYDLECYVPHVDHICSGANPASYCTMATVGGSFTCGEGAGS